MSTSRAAIGQTRSSPLSRQDLAERDATLSNARQLGPPVQCQHHGTNSPALSDADFARTQSLVLGTSYAGPTGVRRHGHEHSRLSVAWPVACWCCDRPGSSVHRLRPGDQTTKVGDQPSRRPRPSGNCPLLRPTHRRLFPPPSTPSHRRRPTPATTRAPGSERHPRPSPTTKNRPLALPVDAFGTEPIDASVARAQP